VYIKEMSPTVGGIIALFSTELGDSLDQTSSSSLSTSRRKHPTVLDHHDKGSR